VPALVVVPTALQASRAARRLCDAGDGLLFGHGVTTLDALVARLLAAAGERRAVLTPLAERLLAVEAGKEAGGPLAGLEAGSGLASTLASALSELRRGEVSVGAARGAAASLEGAAAERLGALARALGAFEARLSRLELLDPAGAIRAAAEAVGQGVPIDDGGELDLLLLDGFTTFSPGEWALCEALAARARRTRFQLPYFSDVPALSGAAEPLLRRVEALNESAGRREPELFLARLDDPARASKPAALLAALGGARSGPAAQAGELLALAGAGEDGEAALAARTAARFIADGIPPSEVVVFAPSPRRAATRLAAAFAAEGVPFAAGRATSLAELPVVAVALAALSVAGGARDRQTLERLASSSYLVTSGLGPRLGPLLDAAGAIDGRATPEASLRRRAEALDGPRASREREALERAADGLASLTARLRPLSGDATAAAHASRLTAFVDGAGVRRQAGQGEPAVATRDLAALSSLEETADELVRALTMVGRSGERLGAGEWRALLQLAVERASLRAPREPVAGAVELDGFAEAPGRSVRAAILVGCSAGEVPAPTPAEPLLREPERQAVNGLLRRAALITGAGRRAVAFHQVACAVAAGRERLAVLWPGPGPAGGGEPSPLLAQALAEAGVALPEVAPLASLGESRTRREALLAGAALARGGASLAALQALAAAGLEERASEAFAVGAIERERREAVLAAQPSPYAGALSGAGLERLLARLPVEWSAYQLENLARCPFRFLLSAGTGLRDPEEAGLDIDGRDEGRLLHAVLERWVRGRIGRGAWPPAGSGSDLDEARLVALAVFGEFEGNGEVGDPAVWGSRRDAVLARLSRVVEAESRRQDGLAPALLEHQFGGQSAVPPLTMASDGETVALQGRIDRVDAAPGRLLVIDYKNSADRTRHRKLLDPETFGVTSFQVPIYLLAAERALPDHAPAATYLLLRSAERVEPVEGRPDEAALARAVVTAVRRAREGQLPIASRDCKRCGFGAVCRFEGVAMLEADADGEGAP
jgi:PD-(D/E)XK nuclease superfamily